jgi:hypothetical protein
MRHLYKGMQNMRLRPRDIYFRTTKLVLWLAYKPDNEDFGSRTGLSVDATALMFENSTCEQATFEVLSFVFPFIRHYLNHPLPNII